jgi:hypothetical protein
MSSIQAVEFSDLRIVRNDSGKVTSVIDINGKDVGLVTADVNPVTGGISLVAGQNEITNLSVKEAKELSLLASAPPAVHSWYASAKYGLMSHYSFGGVGHPQTCYADGSIPTSVTEAASAFDSSKYAAACASFGVEYVVFTAFHYAMHVLYPSAVMNSYMTGHASTRDVIADLIAALKPYKIKLVLYIHPLDGADLQAGEQTATGWGNSASNYAEWNTFINALFTEMGLRYGTDVAGYWVDQAVNPLLATYFSTVAQANALRTSMLAGNPARVIIGNRGDDTQTWGLTGPQQYIFDYRCREYNPAPAGINDWVASYNGSSALATNTGEWWAKIPRGTPSFRYTASDFYRHVVLQIATTNFQGGGIMLNASPYAGSDSGSIFEDGVETGMQAIAAYLSGVRESLTNVVASPSFIGVNTATINNLATPGYVATTSKDLTTEYIHVLKAPAGTLTITAPSDGAIFESAINLTSGNPATLSKNADGGYTIALSPTDSWNAVLTVIRLVRTTGVSERIFIDAVSFTTANGATFQAQGGGSRFPTWRIATATNQQIQCTYAVPHHWRAFAIDMCWTQSAAGTASATMSITTSQVASGEALTSGDVALVSGSLAQSGTINLLSVTNVTPRLAKKVGALNHIRIGRASDGGATCDVLGVMLRRVE